MKHHTPLTASTNGKPRKPPAAPPRPAEPCHRGHAARWWLSPGNEWVCNVCHPDPALLRAEWLLRRAV